MLLGLTWNRSRPLSGKLLWQAGDRGLNRSGYLVCREAFFWKSQLISIMVFVRLIIFAAQIGQTKLGSKGNSMSAALIF